MSYSENSINVFKKLYFRKDENGEYLENHPNEVFARVANKIGEDVEQQDVFYNLMANGYFRPNTPCLINVGVQEKPQTAACFVGGLQDDLTSIFNFDLESGIIFASGSGIGGNFGVLREKDALLSSGGRSSGPFAFMKKWAATAEAVKSGGSARRAAQMCMFFDNHPDLIEFITLKTGEDQKTLRSMNLSVAISDDFMHSVVKNLNWNLIGVVDKKVKSTHKAKDIFDLIANNAFKSGDPGVWFINTVNQDNALIKEYGRMISTNPCGEQSLHSHACCALASINLSKFVKDGSFDWEDFRRVIRLGTIFLDRMISISGYPTPDYERMANVARPIGLGIMGLADVLCMMNISYDSVAAFKLSEEITRFMTKTAIEKSIELAAKYGLCDVFKNNQEGIKKLCAKFGVKLKKNEKVRNSNWTTIAPTGSISISCGCSPGMEPLFGITYIKNIADSNEKWIFVNPLFENLYSEEIWYAEAIKKITENHGSCQGIACVPIEIQKVWKVAHDIKWEDRIEMQSYLQRGISNSISSTVNLPSDATVEDIKNIYMMAWQKGLKGVTIYRDGTLKDQPVEFSKKECVGEKPVSQISKQYERPRVLEGKSYLVKTAHGKMYFTINTTQEGNVIEIFSNGGKNGNISAANLEAIARLSSLALQYGAPTEAIAHTLVDINDGKGCWDKLLEEDSRAIRIDSIPDAVGKVLYKFYINNKTENLEKQQNSSYKKDSAISTTKESCNTNLKCPDCGSDAYMKEGCIFCNFCGSKCS